MLFSCKLRFVGESVGVCRLPQIPGHLPYIPHGRGQRASELTVGETRSACFSAAVVAEWACKPARSARHSRKLQLMRSGEPSRISFRKSWISPLLRTSPECPLRDIWQVPRLCVGWRQGNCGCVDCSDYSETTGDWRYMGVWLYGTTML